ncbi:hypothetical protein QP880_03425 [Dermabacter hominis]|uniref:WXG100 family type VII secretion target n=1 Tax=Dermabacter hominis TaxID=36740 RepID=UPI00316AC6BA|nr:hypothetical protein [Dermabacter hominis]
MGGFLGMDTEQARDSARALNDLAGRLTADATRVKDEAGAVPWEGADAEAFRARVSSIVAPGMHEAVKQLFALAHALQSNALEQDAASNASDASSGGAGSSSALGLAEATRTQALGITALAGLTEGMRSLFGRGSRRVRAMGRPNTHTFNNEIGKIALEAIDYASAIGRKHFHNPHFTVTPTTEPSELVGISAYTDSHPPRTLADLLYFTEEARHALGAGEDRENYRIQHFRTAAGENTWVMYVPPTQIGMGTEKAWDGTAGNSRDWASNMGIMAGKDVTTMKNARAALEAAGVPKGANVMLVGHSQGGLVSVALSSKHEFNGENGYNVTDVITFGSPVDAYIPAQTNTRVFAIGHRQGPKAFAEISAGDGAHVGTSFQIDPVPLLDLDGLSGPHSPQVTNIALTPANDHKAGLNTGISLFKPGHAPFEVALPGYDAFAVHDSLRRLPDGSIDPHYGYYPTLLSQQELNPDLLEVKEDIDGLYMGEGLTLVEDINVQFVREPATAIEPGGTNDDGGIDRSTPPPPDDLLDKWR